MASGEVFIEINARAKDRTERNYRRTILLASEQAFCEEVSSSLMANTSAIACHIEMTAGEFATVHFYVHFKNETVGHGSSAARQLDDVANQLDFTRY